MGFFDRFKLRFLNLSSSYNYYKENYKILQEKNNLLEENNKNLTSQLNKIEKYQKQLVDELPNLNILEGNNKSLMSQLNMIEDYQKQLINQIPNYGLLEENNKSLMSQLDMICKFQKQLSDEKQDYGLLEDKINNKLTSKLNVIEEYQKQLLDENLKNSLNDVEFNKEYFLKMLDLQDQINKLHKSSEDFHKKNLDFLKHLDFTTNGNDNLELLNKTVTLMDLNVARMNDKITQENSLFSEKLGDLEDNLKYITNYMDFMMFYFKSLNNSGVSKVDSEEYINNTFNVDDNNEYLISIIVPLYNIEKSFLIRAFNSITRQTIGFENLEVIFVDDCSSFKEGTYFAKELSEIYANVKLIFLESNVGTGQSRNFGVNSATGKYIMFLDQDDVYMPNSCEVLYNEIIRNDSDMVCGNYINLSRDGPNKVDWSVFDIQDYRIEMDSVKDHMNLFKVDPSIWAKIFSRKFIKENNLSFCEYYGGDDLLFYHEALFKAKGIVNIDEPIVVYEQRTNENDEKMSFSLNNSFSALKDLMEIYLLDYNLFKEYNVDFVDISLNSLNYFVVRRLKNSSLSYAEFKELIELGKDLFDEFVNHGMKTVPYFNKMFENIAQNDFENAYLEYKKIIS